jgi:uncharacterized protein YndB with AHSA1/START domain
VYREIAAPDRLIYTENYEAIGPGHEVLVTTTFEELDDKTSLKSRLVYQSEADRDAHLHSGMETGMRESFERLEQLLTTLA